MDDVIVGHADTETEGAMASVARNPFNPPSPLLHPAQRMPVTASADHAFTAAHVHALAAAGMSVLIVYVSLMPFAFTARPLGASWEAFAAAMTPHSIASPSDFLANVLLFIPLGYLLRGACGTGSGRAEAPLTALITALSLCALLSVSVEFAQTYAAPRAAHGNDVLAHAAGACLGTIAWCFCGQELTWRGSLAWRGGDFGAIATPLFIVYVLALVVLELLPFAFATSATVVGRHLDRALTPPWELPFDGGGRWMWDVIYYLPAGLLAARSRLLGDGCRAYRVVFMGFVLTALVRGTSLFARACFFDARHAATGAFAFALGWWLCRVIARHARPDRCHQGVGPGLAMLGTVGAAAWFLMAVHLIHGEAVEFSDDFDLLFRRLRGARWLPLAELCAGDPLLALRGLGEKMLLFVPLGLLLGVFFPQFRRAECGLPALALAGPIALFVEFGPMVLAHETAVTSLLCEAGGAWLGCALTGVALPLGPAARAAFRAEPEA